VIFNLRPPSTRDLFWSFVLAFSSLSVLDEVAYLQYRFIGVSASLNADTQLLLQASSVRQLLWLFLALALIPAICEEVLFRGFIFRRFLDASGPGQALMISAVLFGLFHRNLQTLLPTILAGVLLGFVVWKTSSLYNAVVAHATINAWAIVLVNTSLTRKLPWTAQPSQVPSVVLIASIVGIVLAGRNLVKRRVDAHSNRMLA
jgi:membrane protease YdiL (CAAX protease family)